MSNPLTDVGQALLGAINPASQLPAAKAVTTKATTAVSKAVKATAESAIPGLSTIASVDQGAQTVFTDVLSRGFWIRVAIGALGALLFVSGVVHLTGTDKVIENVAGKAASAALL